MKLFFSFIKKEFFHVFRDKKTLLLLFGLPIAQILLFGFALTNEIKNTQIMILDEAKDLASQRVIEKLGQSAHFDIAQEVYTREEIERVFQEGKVKLAVIFPVGFNHDLQHLKTAQIQLIADAADPNTANTLTVYASAIIGEYQQELMPIDAVFMQIQTELHLLYNPELKGATNFVPGVMAMILLLVCVLMTSVSIVKEKEMGTMEVLLVSPFNPLMVIVSKAIPYLVLSIVNLTMILILSVTLLDMPIKGSLGLLYAESILLIITALALGLLISNVTNSQQIAMLVSLMGMLLPTLLFSGFMFPIENMPLILQVISNAVPAKWYYIIVKSIMIKGLGFMSIWKETLILLGMTTFLLVMSLKKFKIRLE